MAKGCEVGQLTSMVCLISSDDEEDAREDLRLKSSESGRKCDEKLKNMEELQEFGSTSCRSSVVVDLTSDEVDCAADPSIRAEAMHVVVVRKKRKRSKKKKKIDVDVVRAGVPSETIETVDTDAVGPLNNNTNTRAASHLALVEAMDKETTAMLDGIVMTEKPLEKIEIPDKDAIGESINGSLRKIEEDVGELVNKDFQPSTAVIDLGLKILESGRKCEEKLKNMEELQEFESTSCRLGVVDLTSDEVNCVADPSIRVEGMHVVVVRKKRKRSKKKKTDVDVVRAEDSSKTIATVDTDADGALNNTTRAENHLALVEAMNKETTGVPYDIVMAEKPLEKIEIPDKDAIGESDNGLLRKIEEDVGALVNKDFQPSTAIIDLGLKSFESGRKSDEKLKKIQELQEFESTSCRSGVVDLTLDEVSCVADPSIRVEGMHVVVMRKKRKRSKKKKTDVDVMRAEEPLETIATVDTDAVGALNNTTRAENHLVLVEAMSKETTGVSYDIVMAEKPLEKIEIPDKDAIGESANGLLRKIEEDVGALVNKDFQPSTAVIDLGLKSFESGRKSEEKLKNKEESQEFESMSCRSGVFDFTSDKVNCIVDPSIRAEGMHVVVLRKKRKRSKKKKIDIDIVRSKEPSETIATVDTDAVGALNDTTRAENHLALVEAMNEETTGVSYDIVMAEKPLEKIEIADKAAIGVSDNGLLREIEEDVGELVDKDFQPSAAVIDMLYSTSDAVACMADLRYVGAVSLTTEVRKKKKRSKKKRKKIEEGRDIHVMRGDGPSKAITPIDKEAVGILGSSITVEPAKMVTTVDTCTFWRTKYVMSAENHAATVETVDLEATDMSDSFVKTEKLLEKMGTMDNDANKKSTWKNESFSKDVVIDLLSSSSDEVEFIPDMRQSGVAVAAAVMVNKKKRRRSKKKKQKTEEEKIDVMLAEEASETVSTVDTQEITILGVGDATRAERPSEKQLVGISENVMRLENHLVAADAMDIKATGISNNSVDKSEPSSFIETTDKDATGTLENPVLQKLLHGPRYFHPLNCHWETCYNCGLEGHAAKNCTMNKQEKPCFVCGNFGHTGKFCTQRIQCYVCKSFGHLCCQNIIDTGPREVSCYNCGQAGHKGEGCAKPRGRMNDGLPILCYNCGEDGHLARGCAKSSMEQPGSWMGKSPTPVQRFSEKGGALLGYRSTPYYGIPRAYTWRRTQ